MASTIIKVNGNNGTSIVFSWTWNENKKNENDEVSNAYFSSGRRGPGPVDVLPTVSCRSRPHFNSPKTLGRNPTAVNTVESLTRASGEARYRHLTAILEKHQKFATLSSNNPLENGNILLMGSKIVRYDENGGRKGRNRMRNATLVVIASLMNNLRLFLFLVSYVDDETKYYYAPLRRP